jgi:excisionase family DNA binding protein
MRCDPPTCQPAASTFSVRDLCERYGVSQHTILGWICSGELRAVNVGRQAGARKPRWRITAEALAAFEAARASRAGPGRARSPRRKRAAEVIEFY